MNKTCHIASACFSVICESVYVCARSLYLQFVLWFWFYVNMSLRVKTLSCSIVYSVRNLARSVLIHRNKTAQLLQYLTRLNERNLTSEMQWKPVNRWQDGNITLKIKHSFLSLLNALNKEVPEKCCLPKNSSWETNKLSLEEEVQLKCFNFNRTFSFFKKLILLFCEDVLNWSMVTCIHL